jgi:osmotically-inducible protein OsmY
MGPGDKKSGSPRKPCVQVVGTSDVADDVVESVAQTGLRVTRSPDTTTIPDAATARVHVAAPEQPLDDLLGELLSQPPGPPPALTLVPGRATGHQDLLELQAHSTSLIVRWPEAEALMQRLLLQVATEAEVVELPSQADAELTRKVRNTLDAPGLDVVVIGREAALLGTVRSLSELEEAKRRTATFPGIHGVTTNAVVVDAPDVPDGTIKRAVRGVLRADAEIDEGTLVVAVRGGHVTVMGVVADSEEHDELMARVAPVRGVRSIKDHVTVSPEGKRRSLRALMPVRARVRERFPDQEVDVAVFDDVAVLEGRVKNERVKAAVESEVRNEAGVGTVVSNLDTA